MPDSLQELIQAIRAVADQRNWEQFHSPKNLAMALAVEAGELMEHFQWLSGEQSLNLEPESRHEVAMELADVLIYLCRLGDRLHIDPVAAAREKMRINEEKYPVEKALNSAEKYTAWKTQHSKP